MSSNPNWLNGPGLPPVPDAVEEENRLETEDKVDTHRQEERKEESVEKQDSLAPGEAQKEGVEVWDSCE